VRVQLARLTASSQFECAPTVYQRSSLKDPAFCVLALRLLPEAHAYPDNRPREGDRVSPKMVQNPCPRVLRGMGGPGTKESAPAHRRQNAASLLARRERQISGGPAQNCRCADEGWASVLLLRRGQARASATNAARSGQSLCHECGPNEVTGHMSTTIASGTSWMTRSALG
jgi:hypothetical protein